MLAGDTENKFRKLVRTYHPDTLAHGYGHVFRVVAYCKQIASVFSRDGTSIDLDVLLSAAYLHDLGRIESISPLIEMDGIPAHSTPHAIRSACMARRLLETQSFGFSRDKIPAVEHAILAHSFSAGEEPRTIEATILSDADKLDAMGAQGIIRTVAFSVENGRCLDDTVAHFKEKIILLDDLLVTKPAKIIAKAKQAILLSFMDDLVNGT